MLTDIFADRYISIPMWEKFGEVERRFLVQGFRIVIEQLYPYWVGGKESANAKIKLTTIHDKLSMELGLSELAPKCYVSATSASTKPMGQVCKDFVCAKFEGSASADRFMKERISFIELAFRERRRTK